MRATSVKAKLLFTTVSIIVGFVALALIILTHLITSFAAEEIAADLSHARQAYVHYMTGRRKNLLDKTVSWSRLPYLIDALDKSSAGSEPTGTALSELQRAATDHLVVLTDATGRYLSGSESHPVGENLTHLPGVEDALAAKVMESVWDVQGELILVATAPVLAGNVVVGMLALGQPFDQHFAEEVRLVTGRDVLILRGSRKQAESLHAGASVVVTEREIDRLLQQMDSHELGESIEIQIVGQPSVAIAMPILTGDGTLVLSRSLKELEGIAERSWSWILFAGIAIAGLGILFSLRMARRLSEPLEELMLASDELATGDLRAEVRVDSNDEVGRLGESFNAMARRIEKLVHDVRETAMEADRANKAKDKFLASVSHELRTPLTSVRAYAEILLTYGAGSHLSEEKEFLGIIKGESERLTNLIDNVLDLVNMEAGAMAWDRSSFDLRDLATDALRELTPPMEFKQVRPAATVPPEPIPYEGDRQRLQQAVMQVVSNACKFSPSGGTIWVDVVRDVGATEIRIADEGPGIKGEEEKRVIFDKFYQRGEALTDKPDGTGLGLAITKEILDAHGGTVYCEDAEQGGALFVLRLPDADRCPNRVVDVVREIESVPGLCPEPV